MRDAWSRGEASIKTKAGHDVVSGSNSEPSVGIACSWQVTVCSCVCKRVCVCEWVCMNLLLLGPSQGLPPF